jgi:ATP-dependent Lhr-like helicase
VAARYGSFPILLETYRECLRDVFDLPALVDILRRIRSRELRVLTVDSQRPSPFAASLLFSYVANFIYEGDAPLAERRAQALSVNQAELRELLGAAELRELLDPAAIEELERSLQRLDFPLKSADAVHDLLLHVGDCSRAELALRCERGEQLTGWLDELVRARRVIAFSVGGGTRYAAAEDAGRFRDALGVVPARGLPSAFLEPAPNALDDLVSRYARTHGPFSGAAVAARFALGVAPVQAALQRLAERERVVAGEFLPGGRGREWCDANVLRILKQRSLAKLRKQVEPVEAPVFCRFLLSWQHVSQPLPGMDGLISAIEQLQGAPLIASELESEILPARVRGYRASDLDALCASGEVVWRGVEALGSNDGRVSLYLADQYARLAPAAGEVTEPLEQRIVELLERRGALFFSDIVSETGAFLGDVLEALWSLVWAGQVRNDTLSPLRSKLHSPSKRDTQRVRGRLVRGRRLGPPGSEGRWGLTPRPANAAGDVTARIAAQAQTLLERFGVLTREAVNAEGVAGGFSVVYPVLKAMEEAGKLRRGYFVAGLGATQFAHAGAEDHLRALREPRDGSRSVVLAASDPANPYGAALPWPKSDSRPGRSAGSHVILHDGRLLGYLGRSDRSLLTFLSDSEPERGEDLAALAHALGDLVDGGRRRALLISEIDGAPPQQSRLADQLVGAGFTPSSRGFLKRARLSEKAG